MCKDGASFYFALVNIRFEREKLIRMKLEGGGTYIQNVGDLSNPFHVFFVSFVSTRNLWKRS